MVGWSTPSATLSTYFQSCFPQTGQNIKAVLTRPSAVRRGRDEPLTWWRAACCVAWGAGRGRSACTGTRLWLWLETLSRTRNQNPAPGGRLHLEEGERDREGPSALSKDQQSACGLLGSGPSRAAAIFLTFTSQTLHCSLASRRRRLSDDTLRVRAAVRVAIVYSCLLTREYFCVNMCLPLSGYMQVTVDVCVYVLPTLH